MEVRLDVGRDGVEHSCGVPRDGLKPRRYSLEVPLGL
jgi:hypothetical protein